MREAELLCDVRGERNLIIEAGSRKRLARSIFYEIKICRSIARINRSADGILKEDTKLLFDNVRNCTLDFIRVRLLI